MKALVVDAEWKPRKDYLLSEDEKKRRRALIGSQVWCNPRFDIKDKPTPDIEDDEVLIRVKACGICGSDTHLYETTKDGYIVFSGSVKLPCIIGHEYSGIIEKIGKKIVNFKIGDKVAVESVLWCGKCTPCRSGAVNQCERVELAGITVDGAFTEFTKAKEWHCWSINSLSESFEEKEVFNVGALIEPIGCAYNGIFVSGGGFYPGAYATVFGVGPIGLSAVMLLRAAGAGKIIAVDIIGERLKIAGKMGADYTFNINKTNDIEKVIKDITQGSGADLQIEAAGAAHLTIPIMEKLCSKRGKIIYLGRSDSSAQLELNSMVSGAHSLIGSRGHSGYGIYPNIIRLLQNGRLQGIREMITSVFPFNDVIKAFTISTERKDGKIIIDIT